ncbi:MAG: restriction endonuclease [Eubacteriales bacterium]
MKPGTEYECWVKYIYECILAHEGVENAELKHNVILTGAGGVKHQIDIYWEFRVGGTLYKTAFECKEYKNPVPKEKIAAFHSIIDDIGGVTGVYVSKNGFQSGAVELAKQYGITTVEIRPPLDRDWEGSIRNIVLKMNLYYATNVRAKILIDQVWAMENNIVPFNNEHAMIAGMHIEDIDNDKRISLSEMTAELNRGLENEFQTEKGLVKEYRYNNAFLVDEFCGTKWKIRGLIFTYDIAVDTSNLEINGDRIIAAIVKNVTEGTTKRILYDGSVTE